MIRRLARWLSAVAIAVPAIGRAQRLGEPVGVMRPAPAVQPSAPQGAPQGGRGIQGLFSRDSAWWVPLSSTVLPGLGQVRLGQNRFVAYMAAEAYALMGWYSGAQTVHRETLRYRELARGVARAFVPGNEAIGDWDYYEAMEKHLESGVFDRTPGSGVFSPEADLTTFNGSIWLRARELSNWPDVNVEPSHDSPIYLAAVSYYAARAVRPEYRWSWRNAQLEWDDYRQAIRRKNDANRDAGHFLAFIAVNHLLSTIDAFVTLRLQGGLGAPDAPLRVTGSVKLP